MFDTQTQRPSVSAKPDGELYGTQHTNGGKVVIFAGALPIISNGSVTEAVGVSVGTLFQDISFAEAAMGCP
jgi:uncharacterized protein GlcG (DUF336 family)